MRESSATPPPPPTISLDAMLPPQMALKAESVGVAKAEMGPRNLFALAVLAGAFVSMGAVFATSATAGAAGELTYGVTKVLGGVVFCLGLILVIVAGAELFTGNNLIVMAWADRKVSTQALLRNWGIVYLGNFVGSIASVVLVWLTGQHAFGNGLVGLNALNIAATKTSFGFFQAIALGVLCNAMVCLAVWLCFSARTTTDKILSIIFPITAFVTAGFEHSIANMYFIPMGLLIKAGASEEFWLTIDKSPADYPSVTWSNFLLGNLLPVTIGNIIGGSLMVGMVYWFIYIRKRA